MVEYGFELKFKLADGRVMTDALGECPGKSGCDDALVGIGQPGRVALHFSRKATCARRAVVSALKDARKVLPDAELIEVSPNVVSGAAGGREQPEHV